MRGFFIFTYMRFLGRLPFVIVFPRLSLFSLGCHITEKLSRGRVAAVAESFLVYAAVGTDRGAAVSLTQFLK